MLYSHTTNNAKNTSSHISHITAILIFMFMTACAPSIYYLGDTYPPTTDLEIFYDEKDVGRAYVTIGKMTHDKFLDYSVEVIKQEMIKAAKMRGADAIVFSDFGDHAGE
ncbi:hypothetical protein OKW21_002084 [Catalinimonas alkaloidigena]|uniref:hypothetical protein n=1 Tax=Catalinimonas alkaloidigena TaxID=1075417 RepID=UPI002406BFF5|nr:hypothetical protein [Catalinimonas alkaloidigena]MDF9796821.1 hypothetical protein [Catalinimonas alkaloidigena]